MKKEKITMAEIRAINLGESKVFRMATPDSVNSAKATAYHVNTTFPNSDVKYSTKKNMAKLEITITGKERRSC